MSFVFVLGLFFVRLFLFVVILSGKRNVDFRADAASVNSANFSDNATYANAGQRSNGANRSNGAISTGDDVVDSRRGAITVKSQ